MSEDTSKAPIQAPQVKPTNGMATAGFVLAFFTLIPFLGCGNDDQQATSPTTQSSSTSEATPETAVEQSRKVKVGNLELEVVGIESYDASVHNMFNDANTRVELKVRKIRGDEYDFTLSTATLIDTDGVGYDTYFACTDCPGSLGDTKLYSSTEVTRYVYFEIPPGTTVTHLRYKPFSITTDPVTIPIPK
ncbi:DUF4352 domain-containing protein [Candidatus Poriferisocius sp.]|uniref:DUF4352 domain-containing protein n=1 Tax=Candidatus Poriferisocius sp. TaxID=3101276 RepID=UPI003B0137FC